MLKNAWREANHLPQTPKVLRNFGLVVGGALLLLAAFLFWRADWQAGTLVMALGVGGLTLVITGLLVPGALRPLYPVWMTLALVLGTIMTAVLLTAVFYLIVTPIGLLMRLAGKDPMNRRPDPKQATYWIKRAPESNHPSRLEKFY